MSLYAGPKEYRTLASIADRFNNNLDAVMSFGWAGFVSKALLLGMNWLHHALGFSYGWAIIAITVIIKTIFWPLTQASTLIQQMGERIDQRFEAVENRLDRISDTLAAVQTQMAGMTR